MVQTPTPPTPAPAEAPVLAQGQPSLEALQAQAATLRVQLAGLRAEWTSLKNQLDQMLRNNPARPGVQQKWADVAVQRAQVEGDLARIEAQIAERTGVPVGVPGVPGVPPRFPNVPPFGRSSGANVVFPIGAVVLLAMLFPVTIAWAKRVGRGDRRPAPLGPRELERLERMEQAIDAVAIEVERVSEGQRFITKILADRPQRAAAESAPQQSEPVDQPMRALGAGPAELLDVREREQVRQRINTPH
jgi:hypothetical protein